MDSISINVGQNVVSVINHVQSAVEKGMTIALSAGQVFPLIKGTVWSTPGT